MCDRIQAKSCLFPTASGHFCPPASQCRHALAGAHAPAGAHGRARPARPSPDPHWVQSLGGAQGKQRPHVFRALTALTVRPPLLAPPLRAQRPSPSSPLGGQQAGAREMQVPGEALGLLVPRDGAYSQGAFPQAHVVSGETRQPHARPPQAGAFCRQTAGGGGLPGEASGEGTGTGTCFLAPHLCP